MLAPDDWREWTWGAVSYDGGFNLQTDKRLWRLTVHGGATGGTLELGPGGAAGVLTIAANETLILEPFGMQLFALNSSGDVTAQVEFIQKL